MAYAKACVEQRKFLLLVVCSQSREIQGLSAPSVSLQSRGSATFTPESHLSASLRSRPLAVFLLVFGQWFFVNMVFHYWKALTTGPGEPPGSGELLPEVTSICKKCVSPKPPRTHHCRDEQSGGTARRENLLCPLFVS